MPPRHVARRWFLQQCGLGMGRRRSRWFLRDCGVGLGAIALERPARECSTAHSPSHCTHPAKAKRVIYLFMAGAPSHLELFDNKPQLAEVRRHAAAAGTAQGLPGRVHQPELEAARARSSSSPSTASAAPSCRELLPHLAEVVDDIAIVKSMVTDAFNHAPAQILMNTGSQQFGRPSIGRVGHLRPRQRVAGPARLRRLQHRQQGAERRQLELGQRLPADRLPGRAVPRRRRPGPLPLQPAGHRRRRCSATRSTRIAALNQMRLGAVGDPEIATRINSFEMAYRMQSSAPELMDLSQRAEGDARHVRRRAGQAVVRQQLPAGPPAGRARRPVRAALPRGLGPARQPRQRPEEELRRTPTRPAPRWSRT